MNDEIKEILADLNLNVYETKEWKEPLGLSQRTWKTLLDYITNLQQENDKLKKLEYKFFYCSEDEESFTLEDYLELGNKVYDLGQENERLKEQVKREVEVRDYEVSLKIIYKSRIEKAIPMLKELNIKMKSILNTGIDIKEISDIEDTLNGRSDE